LADIMVMPAIVRMADLGRDGDWQDLPPVQRWYDAIRAYPAFAPTFYPGSLLTERFAHLRKPEIRHQGSGIRKSTNRFPDP
jgi:glutathione S-transferase